MIPFYHPAQPSVIPRAPTSQGVTLGSVITCRLCYNGCMPSKNTLRFYDAPAFYHVYNRGANKQPIFMDDTDREKFLSLLARHLDPTVLQCDANGKQYEKHPVDLAAYCLMDNHFHLLLFQPSDPTAISKLLKSVSTAYTMHFNKRHRHQGTIFQGVFKASHIDDESYLMHISRYIHMNPFDYMTYRWSSLPYYLDTPAPGWVKPGVINDMSPAQYRDFMQSYLTEDLEPDYIREQLANY